MSRENPYEDEACVAAFIEDNWSDFEYDMAEMGVYSNYYHLHESTWVQNREADFFEFADKWYADSIEDEADKKYDLWKDLQDE